MPVAPKIPGMQTAFWVGDGRRRKNFGAAKVTDIGTLVLKGFAGDMSKRKSNDWKLARKFLQKNVDKSISYR